jgi:hypothetical protein
MMQMMGAMMEEIDDITIFGLFSPGKRAKACASSNGLLIP